MKHKFLKRALALLMVVTMLGSLVSSGPLYVNAAEMADITLSIVTDKEQIKPLDEIMVSVKVDKFASTLENDSTPQVNIISFEMPIDTELFEFVEFNGTSALFGQDRGAVYSDSNKSIKVVGYDIDGYDFETTPVVVEFIVKVKEDAVLGKTISFSPENAIFNNIYYIDDKDYSYTCNMSPVLYSVEAPILAAQDETVKGKADGVIDGITTTMEYRKEGETVYTAITNESMKWASGTYYIRYMASGNYAPSEDTKVIIAQGRVFSVTIPAMQEGYTLTVDDSELEYGEKATITYVLSEGYEQTEAFAIKINNQEIELSNGQYVIENASEDIIVTVEGVRNNTKPEITGIVEGDVYCSDVEFSVTDDIEYTVTVDGQAVQASEGKYSIVGDNKSHTVIATDNAGNASQVTITVNSSHTWEEEFTIDKAATTEEDGEKSKHCAYCDARTEITTIPKVVNVKYGDVNGDGGITVDDVIDMKKDIVGYNVNVDEQASDVNCDGRLSVDDVIMVMKYIVGFPDIKLGVAQ